MWMTDAVRSEVAVRSRRRLVLALLLVVLTGSIALVYWWTSQLHYPWLFAGATASYFGETGVTQLSINMSANILVLNLDASQANTIVSVTTQTSLTPPSETRSIMVIDLRAKTFAITGWTLNRTFEDHAVFPGLGVRECTCHEFYNDDDTLRFFVDDEFFWPLKMTLHRSNVNFDIEMIYSNIPGIAP
jgi:hypothetical protein